MTNIVFKLMMFSIILNLSVGVVLNIIPDFGTDPSYLSGITELDNYEAPFISNMNNTVNPSGLLEDKGDANYRILDMLNVGMFQEFLNTLHNYLYGFVTFMENFFKPMLVGESGNKVLSNSIFGVIKVLISLGYIMGAFVLWTGKNPME